MFKGRRYEDGGEDPRVFYEGGENGDKGTKKSLLCWGNRTCDVVEGCKVIGRGGVEQEGHKIRSTKTEGEGNIKNLKT